MININFNNQNIFAFKTSDLSITIHQHEKGEFLGETRCIGNITFANLSQAIHFGEMIEIMVENINDLP